MKTSSPNPNWKPGDKIQSPQSNLIQISPEDTKVEAIYKLMIGAIAPRPIAFVSTLNSEGVTNLAPFSFFNGVCSNPPCIMISIARKPTGEKKDSLLNIEANRQFVVNSANEWLAEPLVHCAASYPFGVDEMKTVGLTPQPSVKIKPFRVKESAMQMECEVYKTIEVGEGGPGSSTVIIGKVLLFHIMECVYQNGRVLSEQFKPLARLGGINYCIGEDEFQIPIPDLLCK